MGDFLAANNTCGQELLKIVANGNAFIADLLRLVEFVPPDFKFTNRAEAGKYADIIFDFSYFSKQEYFDEFINNRPVNLVSTKFEKKKRKNFFQGTARSRRRIS